MVLRWTRGVRGDQAPRALSSDELKAWLIAEVVKKLHLPPEEVQTTTSLLDYGIDSVQAASISGGLEKLLGRRLSPALVWDYPTIDELVRHLSAEPT